MKTYFRYPFVSGLILAVLFMAFSYQDGENKEQLVLISTNYGDMTVKLYNETPKHRDNFIELVKKGGYDSLLFHRVIYGFMIQGGDPDSKHAEQGKRLGNGGPGYTVPAEFVDTIFHKKGALAAAREGDNVNPEKKSSGSQFYLVQGKVFTDKELDQVDQRRMNMFRDQVFSDFMSEAGNEEYKEHYQAARKAKDQEALNGVMEEINPELEKRLAAYKLSPKQREIYKTTGGVPHLDGAYTVFGELVDGFNVLDSIATVRTDRADRPMEDVVMEMKLLN